MNQSEVREPHDLRELLVVIERIYQNSTRATAFEIANEGRRYLECDRLSIFRLQHRRCQILSVSGVDRVDVQSRHCRVLSELVEAVAVTSSRFTFELGTATTTSYPPQVEIALQRYLDTAQCTSVEILPWTAQHEPADHRPNSRSHIATCFGGLVIECLSRNGEPTACIDTEPQAISLRSTRPAERLPLFNRHASNAFERAIEIESVPLTALGRRLQFSRHSTSFRRGQWLRRSLAIGLAVSVMLAAFLIPAELTVQASGRFHPGTIQHIYAPLNGEVVQYRNGNESILEGETVVALRSREWELKKEEVLTQRGIALERLRGIESVRLNSRRSTSLDSSSGATSSDWSATERELREVLSSQDEQLVVIDQVLDGLNLRSPLTGTIVSWNPLEVWEGRPVRQGQKLMTIAAGMGDGHLELRIQDSDLRHVLAARDNKSSLLEISFALASDPGRRFRAQLREVGSTAETLSEEGATVRAIADVFTSDGINAPDGATAVAYIRCGRTSFAYAWTRRIWDYMQVYWLP